MSISVSFSRIAVFAAAAAIPASAMAQHHMPGSMDHNLRASCASQIPYMPINFNAGATTGTAALPRHLFVLSHTTGQQSCSDFNWIAGSFHNVGTFTPAAGWPPITSSDWDCNHSTVEYGVYFKYPYGTQWNYAGGGLMYGKLVNGQCTHVKSNFPSQPGSVDSVTLVNPIPWYVANMEYRVAVRAWSHNDVNIGHPGNVCSDPVNCWWMGWIKFVGK